MLYRKNSNTGFTFVEVMVALIILLITASGVLSSFVAAKRYIGKSKLRIAAITFAREKIEELRASKWYSVTNPQNWYGPANSDPDLNGLALTNSLTGGWTNYKNSVTEFGIKYGGQLRYKVEAVTGQNYRKVTLEAKWNAQNF